MGGTPSDGKVYVQGDKKPKLHHSATKPQLKPLTAETAEGAEIRRKSKGRD